MIYIYECPNHGEIEIEHKITDPPKEDCPKCQEDGKKVPIKRLIGKTSFVLNGGRWGKTNYS